MTLVVPHHFHPAPTQWHTWSSTATSRSSPAPPVAFIPSPSPHPAHAPAAATPTHNARELTREMLIVVLNHLSTLLPPRFDQQPVRLVVHGGACMLLHPDLDRLAAHTPPFLLAPKSPLLGTGKVDRGNSSSKGSMMLPVPSPSPAFFGPFVGPLPPSLPFLSPQFAFPHINQVQIHDQSSSTTQPRSETPPPDVKRTQTRDIDIIARSFDSEWRQIGITNAYERLKECINLTARKFGLGLDWMNADADVALPMAYDPIAQTTYDPIHTDALKPNNVASHTIYTSPNGMLSLISVTPFWAVALKLVRYTKSDPGDICLILRNGTNLSGTKWTADLVEKWLVDNCWPMGYSSYDSLKWAQMKARIEHAVSMVNAYDDLSNPGPTSYDEENETRRERRRQSKSPPPPPPPPKPQSQQPSSATRRTKSQSTVPSVPPPAAPSLWHLDPSHAFSFPVGYLSPPPRPLSHIFSEAPPPTPPPSQSPQPPEPEPSSQRTHQGRSSQRTSLTLHDEAALTTLPPPVPPLRSSPSPSRSSTTSSYLPRSVAEWVTTPSPIPSQDRPSTQRPGLGRRSTEPLIPFLVEKPRNNTARHERRMHTWPRPGHLTSSGSDGNDEQDEQDEEEERAKEVKRAVRKHKVAEWLEISSTENEVGHAGPSSLPTFQVVSTPRPISVVVPRATSSHSHDGLRRSIGTPEGERGRKVESPRSYTRILHEQYDNQEQVRGANMDTSLPESDEVTTTEDTEVETVGTPWHPYHDVRRGHDEDNHSFRGSPMPPQQDWRPSTVYVPEPAPEHPRGMRELAELVGNGMHIQGVPEPLHLMHPPNEAESEPVFPPPDSRSWIRSTRPPGGVLPVQAEEAFIPPFMAVSEAYSNSGSDDEAEEDLDDELENNSLLSFSGANLGSPGAFQHPGMMPNTFVYHAAPPIPYPGHATLGAFGTFGAVPPGAGMPVGVPFYPYSPVQSQEQSIHQDRNANPHSGEGAKRWSLSSWMR